MSNPSTTVILPDEKPIEQSPEQDLKPAFLDALFQRDRLWLLIIVLIIAGLFLGGCHARSDGCQPSSGGSSNADAALAVFYVAYVLVWIIASAAGG